MVWKGYVASSLLVSYIWLFQWNIILSNSHHVCAFVHGPWSELSSTFQSPRSRSRRRMEVFGNNGDENIFYDDFDFFDEDDEDSLAFAQLTETRIVRDLSGSQERTFRLGEDVMIVDFIGSLGFEEVTDWEYYYESEDDDGERQVVQPSPLDSSKPRRTRSSSGSLVRLFRGEFIGNLGNVLRSRGLDRRVLLKEFSGETAIDLAKAEIQSVGTIQSAYCEERNENAKKGDWFSTASSRYVETKVKDGSTKADDQNLVQFIDTINKDDKRRDSTKDSAVTALPFAAIFGQLSLLELLEDEDFDPNEWYRAMGVKPPKPGSIWLVYEYTGLSTLDNYAQPSLKRWSNLPTKRGIWGNVVPPPALPPWRERARYVINGVLKGALEAVAVLHENGIVHRSIGKTSIILSSTEMDTRVASSPLTVTTSLLRVKLSDLGFSGLITDSVKDEGFRTRARTYKIDTSDRYGTSAAVTNFAIAEDLHALGFVFIAVLLSTLADIPSPNSSVPSTDEDTLQRLLGDIFEKDMDEFRDYCQAEEIWGKVVSLLDENNGAGWELLKAMCFAREKASEMSQMSGNNPPSFVTARGLLSSPFFDVK